MAKVTMIPSTVDPRTHLPQFTTKKRRVCAYARVSTDSDEQFTSYEAQIEYYTKYIKGNPEWEFVDVYTDEGITGTSTKRRAGFKQMINDALDGKIDLIVTKSVSRFARNTVDSLTTIRKLKEKGIEIFFQKENIYTLDSKGELMVTIMSSIAQEESRSISENVTMGKRWAFKEGKVYFSYKNFLGYDKGPDGKPIINEEEASIIRYIYRAYLEGKTSREITDELNRLGVPAPGNKTGWHMSTILSILKNEKYKGDALLQKKFTVNFLEHKMKKNEGEVPQYYVEGNHPAIIPPCEWEAVQIEMTRRTKVGRGYNGRNPFASKVLCGDCGGIYGIKIWHSNTPHRREVFQCNQKFSKAKERCKTPTLTVEEVQEAFVKAFNILLLNKDGVIEDINMMIELLCDSTELDEKIERQTLEVEMLTDQVRKLVEDNASRAQSQEEYINKYNKIKEIFDKEIAKLEELRDKKTEQIIKRKAMESYLKAFIEAPEYLEEWSEPLFHLYIDKVLVFEDSKLEFIFKNGSKIKVDISKTLC